MHKVSVFFRWIKANTKSIGIFPICRSIGHQRICVTLKIHSNLKSNQMSAHPDYKHLEKPGLIIATVNTFILHICACNVLVYLYFPNLMKMRQDHDEVKAVNNGESRSNHVLSHLIILATDCIFRIRTTLSSENVFWVPSQHSSMLRSFMIQTCYLQVHFWAIWKKEHEYYNNANTLVQF